MVSLIVVVVVVLNVLVCDAAIIDMVVVVGVLVIDVLADMEIIVVGAIMIVLRFAVPLSYSVNVSSSGMVDDLSMDVLAGSMLGALTGIDVGVLSDVSANAFAVVMTALEFPVSTPLEGFSR